MDLRQTVCCHVSSDFRGKKLFPSVTGGRVMRKRMRLRVTRGQILYSTLSTNYEQIPPIKIISRSFAHILWKHKVNILYDLTIIKHEVCSGANLTRYYNMKLSQQSPVVSLTISFCNFSTNWLHKRWQGESEELKVFPGLATKTEQNKNWRRSQNYPASPWPLLHKHLEWRNKIGR